MVTVDVVTSSARVTVRKSIEGVVKCSFVGGTLLMTADEAVELSRALSFVAGLLRSVKEVGQ